MSQNEKMTLTLEQDENGVMNAYFTGEGNDSLRVLSTAVMIFLNDTKALEHYIKAAEIHLTASVDE